MQILARALIVTTALFHNNITSAISHSLTHFHSFNVVHLTHKNFGANVGVAVRRCSRLLHVNHLLRGHLSDACAFIVVCIEGTNKVVARHGALLLKHSNHERAWCSAGGDVHVPVSSR
ncbi:hypothetical protein PR001_g24772 [Phytophthora rubi]|uniref:Uncharacterized protein n=1 Tax=Phytophthora rubi TaxID=129364 RepID=A0A6A3IB23_9STRA|nr:hypothetical protein PR001_g24772 [Phytophthora rubi]